MHIYLFLILVLFFTVYLYYKVERIYVLKFFKINFLYYLLFFILISFLYIYRSMEDTYPIGLNINSNYGQNPEAYTLESILEDQMKAEAFDHDEGSIELLEYLGLYGKDLVLFSYRQAGQDQVKFVEFDRSPGNRLKPHIPLMESLTLDKTTREELTIVRNFRKYLVKVGYGPNELESEKLGKYSYRIERPEGYYMTLEVKNRIDYELLIMLLALLILVDRFVRDRVSIKGEIKRGNKEKIESNSIGVYILKAGDNYEKY